jgi:hypothetical protein
MADTAVQPALDAAENLRDYRALREGRAVEKVVLEQPKTSEAPPADHKPGDAETSGESETPGETVEDQNTEDGAKKPPANKRGLVDEVVKLRRENRELKTRGAPPPPQPQPQPKPGDNPPAEVAAPADDREPDVNNYTDYNKYSRDLVKWEVRNAQREAAAADQRRQAEQAERGKVQTWQSRLSSAAAELADFDAVAFNADLPVSRVMGDAIMESELGPQLLYHLGSHPEEAARISKLSPVSQVRELGKIEASLAKPEASAAAEEENPPTSVISKAPAPIPRPAGSAQKGNPARNIEGMSQAEYRALRESGRL